MPSRLAGFVCLSVVMVTTPAKGYGTRSINHWSDAPGQYIWCWASELSCPLTQLASYKLIGTIEKTFEENTF